MKKNVHIKRIYEDPSPEDGQRILVDLIWPRGVSKDHAALDSWCKQVAPSSPLRKWYGHDPDKWTEFTRRYREELQEDDRSAALADLRKLAKQGRVTLLTASKALDISQAAALQEFLT